MEALIERTAISAFIREKKDFYTALFDADGVMAVGSNMPVFGDISGSVFKRFPPDTMQPGDLYWYSDCYESRGAVSHSNDQVLHRARVPSRAALRLRDELGAFRRYRRHARRLDQPRHHRHLPGRHHRSRRPS